MVQGILVVLVVSGVSESVFGTSSPSGPGSPSSPRSLRSLSSPSSHASVFQVLCVLEARIAEQPRAHDTPIEHISIIRQIILQQISNSLIEEEVVHYSHVYVHVSLCINVSISAAVLVNKRLMQASVQ